MSKTNEEAVLLSRLADGEFDGPVGKEKIYTGHKKVYCGKYIKDGTPVSYRTGESIHFFNGTENELIPGTTKEDYYDSEDTKLEFLQRYGWLIDDEDVKAYSAKYKKI